MFAQAPFDEEAFRKNEEELKEEVLRVVKNFIAEKYLLLIIGLLDENSFQKKMKLFLRKLVYPENYYYKYLKIKVEMCI